VRLRLVTTFPFFDFLIRPNSTIEHHIIRRKQASSENQPSSSTFISCPTSSHDDMNSSLLRQSSDVENEYDLEEFKGFILKPLPETKSPSETHNVTYSVSKASNVEDANTVSSREASKMLPKCPTRPPPPVPVVQKTLNTSTE
jgi:hypothetical protein